MERKTHIVTRAGLRKAMEKTGEKAKAHDKVDPSGVVRKVLSLQPDVSNGTFKRVRGWKFLQVCRLKTAERTIVLSIKL